MATKILLDTCALVWFLAGDTQLSSDACAAIVDPATAKYVSSASAWEVVTKWRAGKAPSMFAPLANNFMPMIRSQGFFDLPISARDAVIAATLPVHHKDPFDRFIIAQAVAMGAPIITCDGAFAAYTVPLIW